MSKLARAVHLFRTQGIAGVAAVIKDRYFDKWLGKQYNPWYGRLVELRGNIATIDGCRFSLDSPAIATTIKSGFLFGEYEKPEREAIQRFLDPALPVVEFGGAVGVVSCLTNRRLSDPRRHVVVEANPALIPLLKKNRDLNQCGFDVLPCMVGYGSSHAEFYVSTANFLTSTSTPAGPVGLDESVQIAEVKTVDLLSILDQYRFERCTLICDIEGGESDLVRHESSVLRERVSTLMMEVHENILGKERTREMLQDIERFGFRQVYSLSNTYVFQNGA